MSYQVKVPLRSLPNFKFLFSDKGYVFFSAYKTKCHKKDWIKRNKPKQKTKQTNEQQQKQKQKQGRQSSLNWG